MAIVTGAKVKMDNNKRIKADTFGNNISILCPNCNKQHILLIALRHKQGSDIDHPAFCNSCGKSYYIISNINSNSLKEIIIKEL